MFSCLKIGDAHLSCIFFLRFFLSTQWVQIFFNAKLTFTSLWLHFVMPWRFRKIWNSSFTKIYMRFHKGFATFKRCCPMTVWSISSYSITASCSKLLHIISNLQWEIWRPPIVKIRDPFCPHCLTPFYASFSNQGSIKETCMSLNYIELQPAPTVNS